MNNQWFQSSSGNGDLALTIKGLLVALIPLFIIAAKFYNVELMYDEVLSVIEGVAGAISAIMVAFGLIRKIANRF